MAAFIRTARAGRPVSIASISRTLSSQASAPRFAYSTAAAAAARGTLQPVLRASTRASTSSSSANLIPYLTVRGFARTMAGRFIPHYLNVKEGLVN